MSLKLVYFAWVRERIGLSDETVDPPASVVTIADLKTWLAARGETYAHAFENPAIIRAAIDKRHAPADAPIADAREIAFFPPMTGG
jgi:molybdopterin synthase sulfur carrier subunit